MSFIPVFKPLIQQSELDAVTKSLKIGWLGMGEFVSEFEKELKNFIGLDERYVVAVNTGHSALHLGMMLIDVQGGKEVITPSFTNVADVQAIISAGGTPVFCDVLEDTLCIDANKAEKLINKKTKAIVYIDYGSNLADHDSINNLAKKYNLRVLHDAAHSLGSFYKGKSIGGFSDITMFSFDPIKTITCIDGGALIVKSKKEMEILHEMRILGISKKTSELYQNQMSKTRNVNRLGFRYHMANPHAAFGVSQIKKMADITKSRRSACNLYNELLLKIKDVRVPSLVFDQVTPFHYYIRVSSMHRDKLMEYLKKNNVETGIHWPLNHQMTLFKDIKKGDLTVSEKIGGEIITLPLHSLMDLKHVEKVCSLIFDFFT